MVDSAIITTCPVPWKMPRNTDFEKDAIVNRTEIAAALTACPMFADLPTEEVQALADVAAARGFVTGDLLFYQGDHADGFYVIGSGRLKICRFGPEGREQILHHMGAGDLAGEVPVFQGGRYPATAVAESELQTLYIPGDAFLELAERRPQLLLDMLAILSRRLRGFVELIDGLALREVSARVAAYLLRQVRTNGSATVRLETSKAALASRLGTVAETLSRTLKKMQTRGMITVDGRTIRVEDVSALRNLAEGEKL